MCWKPSGGDGRLPSLHPTMQTPHSSPFARNTLRSIRSIDERAASASLILMTLGHLQRTPGLGGDLVHALGLMHIVPAGSTSSIANSGSTAIPPTASAAAIAVSLPTFGFGLPLASSSRSR